MFRVHGDSSGNNNQGFQHPLQPNNGDNSAHYNYGLHQHPPGHQDNGSGGAFQWRENQSYVTNQNMDPNAQPGPSMSRNDSQLSDVTKPMTDEDYNALQIKLEEDGHTSR